MRLERAPTKKVLKKVLLKKVPGRFFEVASYLSITGYLDKVADLK